MPITRSTMHREFLAEIEDDIAQKESEIKELEAVRRWFVQKASENNGSVGHKLGFVSGAFGDLTRHAAAEEVLRKNGKAMSIREIVSVLQSAGYAKGIADSVLTPSLHTAMKRKSETFANPERGKWGLRDWYASSEESEEDEDATEE